MVVLWAIQILFFKAYYQSMKKVEIERLGDSIAGQYPGYAGDDGFTELIESSAVTGSLNIIVFSMTYELATDDNIKVNFSADYMSSPFPGGSLPEGEQGSNKDPRIIEDFWEAFFPALVENDRFTYTSRGQYLVYGANLSNNNYLYIASPFVLMDSTTSVLTNQLLIATIICLMLSLILSWFISSRISKPITEFSKVARKLAKGDYSVQFIGNGYTEIEDLAQTLNYATEEMSKTEALRRDFLANVSHDLRTPLTMVKAYAEMIRDISGRDAVKRGEHSQVIIDEADRLTNLVNDILNLSKLQAGTETIVQEIIDLGVIVRVVVERFDIYSTKFGYKFVTDVEPGCLVMGDSRRIEQVLYNLIGNAVNYTGEDKTITIAVKKQNDNKGGLFISDTGKGIAPDEIDAVWERYYRANQRKREVVGSGLGLSIVKNILIAHKAEYGINSKLNEGTMFWFKLPLVESLAPTPIEEPALKPVKTKRKSKIKKQ